MILSQLALLSAALFAAQAPAASAPPADPVKSGVNELSKEQAETILNQCGSRRFETSAEFPFNGKLRRTGLKLCATDKDSGADWIAKLEKAATQIESQPALPDEAKAKLLGDLRGEIARLKSAQSFNLAKPLRPVANAPSTQIARSPAVPITTSPRLPPKSPLAEFNALPPLPRAPAVAAASGKTAVPVRRGPQLTVQCVLIGFKRPQRCGVIATDERLVVRATEAFKGPVNLRFRRADSDVSEEVPFDSESVQAGQTASFRIPKAICAGRIRAEFDIEAVTPVINGGRSGERLGSFAARCGL